MSAIDDFLAMLAAERGAAMNTLVAYRRDLESAQSYLGDLTAADRAALAKLGNAWADLAPSSVARKASALRQFYTFLVDEGMRVAGRGSALLGSSSRTPSSTKNV